MNSNNYIIAYAEITENAVYKNGEQVFVNPSLNLPDFLIAVYKQFDFNYPKFYKMDNLSKLGWLVSEILLSGEKIIKEHKPEDIGTVLSNANSSLDTDIKYLHSLQEFASPALFVYTLPNIVTGEICIRNSFKGENAFFVSETFDAAFAEQYVNNMLDRNIMQLCICGWVELLKTEYKSVLFLVGKSAQANSKPFTTANLDRVFNKQEL